MKKVLCAVLVAAALFIVYYDDIFPKAVSDEERYKPNNEREYELYDYAYTQGQKDAISQMKDAPGASFTYYVNAEDAGDIISELYDDDVRDMILHDPGLEHLTVEDIIDEAAGYVSIND